jgi:hypothetical protein
MHISLHTKHPLFLSDFNETEFPRQSLEKCSNVKFHENASSVSRVIPCGQTDGQTGKTQVTVAFRNFANAALSRLFLLVWVRTGIYVQE